MALKKLLTLNSNAGAEYHRISGVLISDAERVLEVHVQSYVDEATRRATEAIEGGGFRPKWAPLQVVAVKVSGAEFSALFGDGVPDYPDKGFLYAWLRTLPAFDGAVNA